MRKTPTFAMCTFLAIAGPVLGAQGRPPGKAAGATCSSLPAGEQECQSPQSIAVNGHTMKYQVTAGTLNTGDSTAHPTESTFFVSYERDDVPTRPQRPIIFFFNGGPGAASIFLHIASFGPYRIETSTTGFLPPAPYAVKPNPYTLLDTADLVFLDPPNAGYSRPLGRAKPSEYYSNDGDAEIFTRAIQRYLTKYHRWNSPKFLLGESYGTDRAAMVANRLEQQDTAVSGVILLSSALNLGRLFSDVDINYVVDIPSYAAVALHYNRIPGGRPPDLQEFIAQARSFALGSYEHALNEGDDISAEELTQVAEQLHHFTGLPITYIRRMKLRISVSDFVKELLRNRGETLGLLDGRIAAVEGEDTGKYPLFDPSYVAVSHAIYDGFMAYMTDKIPYRTDMTYNIAAQWAGPFEWSFAHVAPDGAKEAVADTTRDLAEAMRMNPYLRVLSLNGLYDLTTPFLATEIDLSHMMLDPSQKKRLTVDLYPAGHMGYMDPAAIKIMHSDLESFIAATLESDESH